MFRLALFTIVLHGFSGPLGKHGMAFFSFSGGGRAWREEELRCLHECGSSTCPRIRIEIEIEGFTANVACSFYCRTEVIHNIHSNTTDNSHMRLGLAWLGLAGL
jgi:hypothetical protein